MQAALPLGKKVILAMALATLQLYAGGPGPADIPATATKSCHERAEPGLRGPVATGTQPGYPVEEGSLAAVYPDSPIKPSVPATAFPSTTNTEDFHIVAVEVQLPTDNTMSVIHPTHKQQQKAGFIQIEPQMDKHLSTPHYCCVMYFLCSIQLIGI